MLQPLDPARTAVLAMDFQQGIVSRYVEEQEAFLARVSAVLERARNSGMRVIYVRVGFRPGLPEVGFRNPFFAAIKSSEQHQKLFAGPTGEIHPALAPQENDVVVVKHQVSAFTGTDLELVLRANDIDTLVLMGIATSGVVLSTVRHAADWDYRVVVVKDCCADSDPEVHACLVEKIFLRQATVVTAAELLEAIG
jgi:nicotinamidase-related amidase